MSRIPGIIFGRVKIVAVEGDTIQLQYPCGGRVRHDTDGHTDRTTVALARDKWETHRDKCARCLLI